MAESLEHMVDKLMIFDELREMFAKEEESSGQQLPQDPENAPIHSFMKEELDSMPLVKYMVKEIIANPHLVLADVRAYRAHVKKNGHCYDNPFLREGPKSTAEAVECRRYGNVLYGKRKYAFAAERYNESICYAPNDSEDLGIGYANRSAVFYETGEYTLTLADIALARQHNYPERLMPKLLQREANCRKMLDEKENPVRCPSLAFNVEPNSRIPFLAKGIVARKLPTIGKSMLAKKGFRAGDVILQEKPRLVSVPFLDRYFRCNHCLAENMFHLIPCPNCTAVMFCNEECRAEGQKVHRFECGVSAELSMFNDFWAGPRMFFHGLTVFGDDVKKMMEFCKANKESGRSFFDVDYSNYDPQDEFRAFLGPKSPAATLKPGFDNMLKYNSAIMYTMYRKVPLVRSLITGKAQKDFMLQCLFDYMTLGNVMSIHQGIEGQLYPIASCFGQSTDPNVLALDYGGRLKLVVLRPIRRGERILVSYGARIKEESSGQHARLRNLGLECDCRLCYEKYPPNWLTMVAPKGKTIVPAHLQTVQRVLADRELTTADKLNALQQFIQRYAHLHPQEDLSDVLSIYQYVLKVSNEKEVKAAIRQNASI